MITARLFPLELHRLLQSRLTWLVIVLSALSPLAGLVLYKPASAGTMLSVYLANPAIAGGAVSGILFGTLTIYERSRSLQSRTAVLVSAVLSPLDLALAQMLALTAAAFLALGLTMAAWLPVSIKLIGSVFDSFDYVLAYLIFMGLALPLAILAAGAVCQLTGRADLSLVCFSAFAGLSLTVWADNWQLCWLNPCVWALSDDFSNLRIFRSAAYMRFTWLTALTGIWAFSRLCIRQYGKGILGSLARSMRRVYRPAAAALLLALSVTVGIAQPLVDHSNPDETIASFLELPYLENVLCSGRSAQVFPNTALGTVSGRASFQFENTSGQQQTAAFGINPGYTVSSVQANGVGVPFSVSSYQEFNEAMLKVFLPAENEIELTVEYSGFPQEDRNSSSMQGRTEISSEYLCLENAALSPRLMNVLPDGGMLPAAIEITLPASMTVIPFGTGEATAAAHNNDGTTTWRYQDNGAGGILYAGDYIRQDIEAGGISVEFYYGRRHQAVMEAADAAGF